MASTNCMELAKYGPFNDRVDYFCKKAAVAIMAENPDTAEHAKRVVFASAVLKNQNNKVAYSVAVCTNGTIAATIGTKDAATANDDVSDGDLEFTVNSLFTAFSL